MEIKPYSQSLMVKFPLVMCDRPLPPLQLHVSAFCACGAFIVPGVRVLVREALKHFSSVFTLVNTDLS